MHNIVIRPLGAGDAERWRELWDGYLVYYRQELPEEVTRSTWQRVLDPSHVLRGHGAIDGANLVGFVHFHFHLSTWSVGDICYLEDLFVDPAARGQGVGQALIESVYRSADAHGATRVYWHTEEANVRAQALYDRVAGRTPYVQYRRR